MNFHCNSGFSVLQTQLNDEILRSHDYYENIAGVAFSAILSPIHSDTKLCFSYGVTAGVYTI